MTDEPGAAGQVPGHDAAARRPPSSSAGDPPASSPVDAGALAAGRVATSPVRANPGQASPPAPPSPLDLHDDPNAEQLRFAMVLNGGVSLAIWMGGAVHEVDRLTRGEGSAYRRLLDWTRSVARVDVIAGTSAGGINGAALAISQCNAASPGMRILRDVWADDGDIARLLRQPFKGSPASLLQGDEYFLPRLRQAMTTLAEPWDPHPADHRPLDLTITGTLLRGIPGVSTDSLGQNVAQTRHDALFRFQRGPTHRAGPGADDFDDAHRETTVAALALAARTTASFPVAFEPSFIPTAAAQTDHLHPDMTPHLSGAWDQSQGTPTARFAVDGGVLANTPTRVALGAVDRMPAQGLVRRVMLLVHPHAPAPGTDESVDRDEPPTVAALGAGILGALQAQGSLNHVEDVARHNQLANTRRSMRGSVVHSGDGPWIEASAVQLYGWYRTIRLQRVSRDLAAAWIEGQSGSGGTPPLQDLAQSIHTMLECDPELSWLPVAAEGQLPAPHELGPEAAIGIADAAADFLRRLNWAVATTLREPPVAQRGEAASTSEMIALDPMQRIGELRAVLARHRNVLLAARAKRIESLKEQATAAAAHSAEPGHDPIMGARVTPGTLRPWLQGALDAGRQEALSARRELAGIAEALLAARQLIQLWTVADEATSADRPCDPDDPAAVLRGFIESLGLGSVETQAGSGPDTHGATPAAGPAPTDGDLAELLLERLNAIAATTAVISDEVTTGASLPIDLAQLTFQVVHPFAAHLDGESKVAGDQLHRFSAFLKRYWRINDWIWGRLDASRTLATLVLQPDRVARALRAMLPAAVEARDAALPDLVASLYRELLGTSSGAVPGMPGLPPPDQVVAELRALLAGESVSATTLPLLREVFAAALALDVAGDELPELVHAVEQDLREGANPRARGAVAVQRNSSTFLAAPAADAAGRAAALKAFATSGIGSEAISDEASSDRLIQTASTAAAVAVSVADGESSGLQFAKPVTRGLRGAALLPHWIIRGLTGEGTIGRGLAILALAAGGAMLALALLGYGPGWFAAVGAGAVLGAFAYGAMRSGTILHGVVLLVPGLTLLAWVGLQRTGGTTVGGPLVGRGASGVGTLLGILALMAGLIILGSLRPPVPSPLAWADSRRTQVATFVILVVLATALLAPDARAELVGSLTAIADYLGFLASAAASFLPEGWVELLTGGGLLVASVVAYLALGWWLALHVGRQWRLVIWGPVTPGAQPGWHEARVEHPTGTTAGWAWVYAALLTSTSLLLLAWFGFQWPPDSAAAAQAFLLAAGVIAVLLAVPVPWYLHQRTRGEVDRQAIAVLRRGVPALPAPDEESQALAKLFAAGLNYSYLVRPRHVQEPGTPELSAARAQGWAGLALTPTGRRLRDQAAAA